MRVSGCRGSCAIAATGASADARGNRLPPRACWPRAAIELQQRLAARAYDKAPVLRGGGPFGGDRTGERVGGGELAAARPVSADEIGIAEIACRRRAIGFASRPQVASGEAAEDRGG